MSRIIFGKRPVMEILEARETKLEKLVLAKGMEKKESDRLAAKAAEAGVTVEWQGRDWFEKKCEGATHQGVVALAPDFVYAHLTETLKLAGPESVLLMLDQVEDPHNLGAILRSAEALGALAVIIPKDHAASISPSAEKASAGASARLPVVMVTNLSQALEEIKEAGFWCYGLSLETQEVFEKEDFKGKVCLVLGNEGRGLRPLVAKNCDKLLKIPLKGKVASLNVSVTAGIALYVVNRKIFK